MMRPIAVLSLLSLASLSAANAAPPASSPAMPNAALRKEQATQTYSEHGAAKSSDLERSFTLGGNVLFPIPIGNSNLVFKDGIGGEAHAWLNNILNQPGLARNSTLSGR